VTEKVCSVSRPAEIGERAQARGREIEQTAQ
jgi:hypothetical protein